MGPENPPSLQKVVGRPSGRKVYTEFADCQDYELWKPFSEMKVDNRSPCAMLGFMEIVLGVVGVLIFVGLGAIFFQLKNRNNESSDDGSKQKIGELQSELGEMRSKRDELQGKNKQLFAELTTAKAELKSLQNQKEELKETVSEYKESDKRREKEFETKITMLDNSKEALEKEKVRVIREDEQKLQAELLERDRIWNAHESSVLSHLTELCTEKEYEHTFRYFTNTKLPPDFDGSLKPDFLIEFLGQYIIFDAKCTKSEDISGYILNAVKSTAKKIKNNAKIYKTIFFVVPTIAVGSLKRSSFHESGSTFHVISPEALSPILAVLKRMSEYELAESMDPEERENIITAIARLDQHINMRNATDLLMTQSAADLIRDNRHLLPDISKEVESKKQKMDIPKLKPSEILRLTSNIDSQEDFIKEIISPKAGVTKKSLKLAAEMQENKFDL